MTIVLNKKFKDPLQAEKQLVEFMGTEKEKETDQKSSTENTESPPSGEGMSLSEPLCLSPVPVVPGPCLLSCSIHQRPPWS